MISRIALSGLNASFARLRTTANNIANSQTTGFKQARTELVSIPESNGVKVSANRQSTYAGAPQRTQQGQDLAINGNGYFLVNDGGKQSYTRAGAFGLDREGYVSNSQGQRLMGFTAQNGGTPVELKFDTKALQPTVTKNISLHVNLDATATAPVTAFDPNNPASFNHQASTTAYDSLGSQHQVDIYYRKTATPNQVEMHTMIDGNHVGGAQTLDFDTSGKLSSPASGSITLPSHNPGNGASNLDIKIDISKTTQTGNQFEVKSISQDGSSAARLTGINIDDSGNVSANFDNGQSSNLGRVAIAQFPNPQGLQPEGNGNFSATADSGDVTFGGHLQAGALESSNVNLEEQFVNLISTQHMAQAAAKMIKTEDEMLGTLFQDKA